MKKRIVCIVLLATLSLPLTACVNTDTLDAKDSSSAASFTSSDTSSYAASSNSYGYGRYATVKEYAESEEVQKELIALRSEYEGLMDITVTGEGDSLVYDFKIITDVPTDDIADILEETLDEQASTFKVYASLIKFAVDVENPSIIVRYLDKNGNLLAERKFEAE